MTYTSCFDSISSIKSADPDAVFIAVSGAVPADYSGERLVSVAPKRSWWQFWHDTYAGHYESKESVDYYTACYKSTVLGRLSQADVIEEVKQIAGERNSYLLCFEPPGQFCHRHLLASWLNEVCDEKVIEWSAGA